MLTQNEIDAAEAVRMSSFNPQDQSKLVWPASFAVARAYRDQLARGNGLAADRAAAIASELDRAERLRGAQRRTALTRLATQLDRDARTAADVARVRALATAVRDLAKKG
jgi:hypothetical protein